MHEQSETVQDDAGKWLNVYGRKTPKAGQPLPGTGTFDTLEEAVKAAIARSRAAGPELDVEPPAPLGAAPAAPGFDFGRLLEALGLIPRRQGGI